jgi:GT2 family glycosyltransferase
MFHSVIIASRGRPEILKATLGSIWNQDDTPDEVIISVVENSDLPISFNSELVKVLIGSAGLCAQRNLGLKSINSHSYLVSFMDDDLELAPDYFSEVRSAFSNGSAIAGANGNILNEGCSREEAKSILSHDRKCQDIKLMQSLKSLYGCNMHFRKEYAIKEQFDERLLLYAWLEDYDYSSRVSKHGPLVFIPTAKLCHLKEPSGRIDNKKFGFAQIMNPFYIHRKGLLQMSEYIKMHFLKVILSNMLKVIKLEPAGYYRIIGNMVAIKLILKGKILPEFIAHV